MYGYVYTCMFVQEADLTPDSFTKLRLHLATSLYYKLLLGIVHDEVEVKKCSITTLQIMLEHDLFHRALFALSSEIVLFSYNSQSRYKLPIECGGGGGVCVCVFFKNSLHVFINQHLLSHYHVHPHNFCIIICIIMCVCVCVCVFFKNSLHVS